MGVRRASVILVLTVVAVGCSTDHKAAPPPPPTTFTTPATDVPPPRNARERAVQACAKVAPKQFVNAKATTVGAIHAITGRRGNVHNYAWILKGSLPESFAAWCWLEPSPGHFQGYVVGPNGEIVDTGQRSNGGGPPRPGPLLIA